MKNTPLSMFLVALSFIMLLGLGLWQIIRQGEKNLMLNELQNSFALEAQELPPYFDSSSINTYSKYKMHGKFSEGKDVLLYSSNARHPEKHGYFILTPFQLDNGRSVLVNRGWIPQSKFKTTPPSDTEIHSIETIVLKPKTPGFFTPKNDENKNVWIYVDLKSMSEFVNTPIEQGFYMVMLSSDRMPQDVMLMPAQSFLQIRNDHLWYAITWFGLAGALVVIYWIATRRTLY